MPLDETEFHCFCCKKKVDAVKGSISFDVYKNGRSAMRGICPHKKCKLSKIISDSTANILKSKYEDDEIEVVDDEDKIEDDEEIIDDEDDEDEIVEDPEDCSLVPSSRVPSLQITSSRVPSLQIPRVPSSRVLSMNRDPVLRDDSIGTVEIGGVLAVIGFLVTSIIIGMKAKL